MEFDESRIYQPGDEIRHMDWRVTARSGQPHVKTFCEERERPVWLWVDQGASMQFGTRGAYKAVRAAEAATLLAWAAVDGGDRVGAMVFADQRHRELLPRSRPPGALRLIETLGRIDRLRSVSGGSRRGPLERLVQMVRPGSLVFLLSDFAGYGDAEDGLLSRLAAHNDVVMALIYDPLEAEPPPPGHYPVSDGRQFGMLDSQSRLRAAHHRERFQQHWQQLRDSATRRRMRSFLLSTATPALEQLLAAL